MNRYALRLATCVLAVELMGLYAASALAQEKLFYYRQTWSSMPTDVGPATVAEHELTIDLSALARSGRDAAEFAFPDGSRFMAVPVEIEQRGETGFMWRGRLESTDEEGWGVITVHNGYVAGRFAFLERDVIELKPGSAPGIVRLLELDSSMFPECDTVPVAVTELPEFDLVESSLPASAPPGCAGFAG